jgi:hypothetical protein
MEKVQSDLFFRGKRNRASGLLGKPASAFFLAVIRDESLESRSFTAAGGVDSNGSGV